MCALFRCCVLLALVVVDCSCVCVLDVWLLCVVSPFCSFCAWLCFFCVSVFVCVCVCVLCVLRVLCVFYVCFFLLCYGLRVCFVVVDVRSFCFM